MNSKLRKTLNIKQHNWIIFSNLVIVVSSSCQIWALVSCLVGGLSSAQSHFPLYACSTHCSLLNHRCPTEKNTPACFSTLFWRKSRLSEISSVRGQLWIFPHWLIAETSARPFYVQLTETVRWHRTQILRVFHKGTEHICRHLFNEYFCILSNDVTDIHINQQ